MTPEERQQFETQIQKDFSDLQKNLEGLKTEVQSETDTTKKQEKQDTIQQMENELYDIKRLIDTLSSLQEEELNSLKTRIEQTKQLYDETRWETADLLNERAATPTTYELLKDSETYNRLLNIISSNPDKFKSLPWENAEKKLEYMFEKIRKSIVLFMKNKLWDSENNEKIINNTIAPAFEWSLMELLRDQWNETNVSMLQWIDKISFDSFNKLVRWVSKFAQKASWSYSKFSQWMNAIDYLSVHNWVLRNPNKSEVLSNPLKFQEYMNDSRFAVDGFSPYAAISDNIFKINESQTFDFGISLQEKQSVLTQIWNIQVVNSPKTTALIASLLDKPEQFLSKTVWLQQVANSLLDWVSWLNAVTKIFWLNILWEITKTPEKRGFLFKILDFVCKLIWITWWLEWIIKKWRLDRMNLTDEKNDNISQIFNKYKELAWEKVSLSITDENSCKTELEIFWVTDPQKSSSTKWDFLRDSIVENMNISLISPAIVQQILWDSYLKKETITEKWETKEKITVDESKITETEKLKLAHNHLIIMKSHLENYKDNDLSDFYANIHSTEDLALCITASLYVNKEDVVEWVKAKVFLPENYGSVHSDWTVESWNGAQLPELTAEENTEMQDLVELSKTPNSLNYLENPTYKKYLNVIERDLHLPKYSLECVCSQESNWKLYSWNEILWSNAWAKWLFQFMPSTADFYMKHEKLKEKYWKTFTSRDEFLKDPLASAWAAGIMYSEFMTKNNYNFQSALACYNRWIGKYQSSIWWNWKNLSSSNFAKLPQETKKYVENITKDILQHNSVTSNDILSVDLSKYLRQEKKSDIDHNSEILIWPELAAHSKDEIWWLWNSIMTWFQWYRNKLNFPHMDWVESKTTQNHPNRFNSQLDVQWYKVENPNIKSFMFYFWANTRDNRQTLSDIQQWSEWLEEEWIQPVLCTCIWEDKHERLKDLNKSLIDLWKEKNRPVFDFAKLYNNWDIAMWWGTSPHPTSAWYSTMARVIEDQFA